ncbi:MAG: hypothetical protein Kow00108_20790 [Calditrichia bacterium]
MKIFPFYSRLIKLFLILLLLYNTTVSNAQTIEIDSIQTILKQLDTSDFLTIQRAKIIYMLLTLDTLRHSQMASYAADYNPSLQPEGTSTRPDHLQISFQKFPAGQGKYRSLEQTPPGFTGSAGVTVGFDLTRGMVQRLLLKGLTLPENADSTNFRFLGNDSSSFAIVLSLLQKPGQTLMDLYLNPKIHSFATFTRFKQHISRMIQAGLIRYIAPKDELQRFFVPYNERTLRKEIDIYLELSLTGGNPDWQFWQMLQKSLQSNR